MNTVIMLRPVRILTMYGHLPKPADIKFLWEKVVSRTAGGRQMGCSFAMHFIVGGDSLKRQTLKQSIYTHIHQYATFIVVV